MKQKLQISLDQWEKLVPPKGVKAPLLQTLLLLQLHYFCDNSQGTSLTAVYDSEAQLGQITLCDSIFLTVKMEVKNQNILLNLFKTIIMALVPQGTQLPLLKKRKGESEAKRPE